MRSLVAVALAIALGTTGCAGGGPLLHPARTLPSGEVRAAGGLSGQVAVGSIADDLRSARNEAATNPDAPGAPGPGESDEGSPAREKLIGVEELIERVAIDRLLTEAVSGLVERNAAAVRDHLKRHGLASKVPAANEPKSDQNDSASGSTPKNLPDGE